MFQGDFELDYIEIYFKEVKLEKFIILFYKQNYRHYIVHVFYVSTRT